ncbi:MAG: cytochrome c [Rhodothermales bacterium]
MTGKLHHKLLATLFASMAVTGCRGTVSHEPPVHPVLNMDFQERFEPQEANSFFADGRAMRPPVPGTIARGHLNEDTRFYYGKEADGSFVKKIPVAVDADLLARGQQRFNINCSPCHGKAGDGKGVISTGNYGMVPAPSYHDDRLRSVEDGYLFNVITNGIRTMPGYGYQVPPKDRWAIISYVRALQRSQNAGAADVPAEVQSELQPTGSQ